MNRKTGGSLDVTISLCKQGVEILKLHLPDYNDDFSTGLHNLGYYFFAKTLYAEAIPCLEESLELKKSGRLSRSQSDETLSLTLQWLAASHAKCNHVEMAISKFKECLHHLKRCQLPDTERTCSVLLSLGNLTYSIHQYEEAVNHYSEAREMLLHMSPHSETAFTVSMLLANSCYQLGQLDKSEECYTEALAVAREFYPDHPITREAEQSLHSLWQLKYGN
jgi:tetratricopeptide (TPR) repeat protein